jgi:hypothetical protein
MVFFVIFKRLNEGNRGHGIRGNKYVFDVRLIKQFAASVCGQTNYLLMGSAVHIIFATRTWEHTPGNLTVTRHIFSLKFFARKKFSVFPVCEKQTKYGKKREYTYTAERIRQDLRAPNCNVAWSKLQMEIKNKYWLYKRMYDCIFFHI